MSKNTHSTAKPNFFGSQTESDLLAKPTESSPKIEEVRPETAIVYCEGNFAGIDGKTANGLARHSKKYKILSIIDSEKEGLDAGEVLDGKKKSHSNLPRSWNRLSTRWPCSESSHFRNCTCKRNALARRKTAAAARHRLWY